MEHEHNVYRFIGSNPFIPKLIDWDSKSRTLVLEDHTNGDLETYFRNHGEYDVDTRRKWALQAAQALESLHVNGVIHQDVTPRNFLLDKNLDLRICDFAGSSFPGHTASTGAPGSRYQSRTWDRGYVPTQADDIFSLGSVLYFIMRGEEPYSNLDENEVEGRFEKLDFPASDQLDCGTVIQKCWGGRFATSKQVVQALVHPGEINRV
jgi:serine/threonine protein kinase